MPAAVAEGTHRHTAGNNGPHAQRATELLDAMGLTTDRDPVPQALVRAAGLQTITNLVVKRRYDTTDTSKRPVVALNAHGDVVTLGDGWTNGPYGSEIVNGKIYGRAAAVSK